MARPPDHRCLAPGVGSSLSWSYGMDSTVAPPVASTPAAASARARVDDAVVRVLDRTLNAAVEHWLALFNAALGAYAALPVLAPLLAAVGARAPANAIFWLYSVACHQMPTHSWFVLGQQMAYCQRNTAIYTTMFLTGLLYAR